MAEAFIADSRDACADGKACRMAIVKSDSSELIGAMGLEIEREHARAELGYWIGVPYWGQGFATEAGLAMLRHGFESHQLNRIMGHCFAGNLASARVLQKLGMKLEGRLTQHVCKWGQFVDVELYAMVKGPT